jgi:hypothetical protein
MAPLVRFVLVFVVVSVGALIAGFLVAPGGEAVDFADVAETTPPPPLVRPVTVALSVEPPTVEPEVGWWWNPDEPGRGFLIDRSGAQIMVGALAYEPDGRASWYLSAGTLRCGAEFSGLLVAYGGGQTLSGRFRKATAMREAGRIGIRFLTTTQATVTLPGGRMVPLERYRLDGGGQAGFEPEPGWWWNPAEPGRGFAVEVRNGAMLLTAVLYDERGNPVWYVSHGPLVEDRVYRGRWLRLAGGMTMESGYRVPVETADAGAVAMRFADARAATLTLPDGRSLPISRFDFDSALGPLALSPPGAEAPAATDCRSPIRVAAAPG